MLTESMLQISINLSGYDSSFTYEFTGLPHPNVNKVF